MIYQMLDRTLYRKMLPLAQDILGLRVWLDGEDRLITKATTLDSQRTELTYLDSAGQPVDRIVLTLKYVFVVATPYTEEE